MSGPILTPVPAPRQPGWYGKIPALGDFASRRLPPGFISFWDAWLQRGLAASRASLQERWLGSYLNGPLWNFALLPGVCGERPWTGTMMPSVDKVGRHFPLTIALELEAQPGLIGTLLRAQGWFAEIDKIALDCLNLDFEPALLEERLATAIFPAPLQSVEQARTRHLDRWWDAPADGALALELPAHTGIGTLLHEAALSHFGRAGRGKSLWWSEMAGGAVRLLAFPGMPAEPDFAMLLGDVA